MMFDWEYLRSDPAILFGTIPNYGTKSRGRENAIALGLTAGDIRYFDLKTLKFTVKEKTYWCKRFRDQIGNLSFFSFVQRYNMKKTSCLRWLKLYNADIPIPDTFSRSRLDEESIEVILQKIANLKKVQPLLKSITGENSIRAPVPIEKVGTLLIAGIKATQNRLKSKTSKVTISDSAIRRFKAKKHIGRRIPEVLTTARAKSSGNPRSAFVWYCLMMAYMNDKSPHYVVNMDGHQLMITEKGSGQLVAHYCSQDSEESKAVAKSMRKGETAIFVKLLSADSQAGISAPTFAIVCVPELGPNDYMITKLSTFGVTSCIDDYGYVCFCQKRSGTTEMIVEFLRDHMGSFFKSIKDKMQLKNIDGTDMGMCFYLDGEALFLSQCYNPEVQQMYKDYLVDVAKGVESGTGEHQGKDRQTTFRDQKTGVKTVSRLCIDVSDDLLTTEVNAAFMLLSSRFKITLTAKFKAKVVYALCVTKHVQQSYSTPAKLRKGYHVKSFLRINKMYSH